MIGTASAELCASLTAAGVPTTDDPRRLNPPAAYLMPSTIDYERMDHGIVTVEWELYLVAPDTEPRRALDRLDAMLDSLASIIPPGEVTPVTFQARNHSPDGLPAFLVNLTTEITKD